MWLFDGSIILEVYTAMYCYCAVFPEVAKTTYLGVGVGGSYSVSRCVRPWIKLRPEYPFKTLNSSIAEDV